MLCAIRLAPSVSIVPDLSPAAIKLSNNIIRGLECICKGKTLL